jgi:DNA-binding transcriptional ArsR family regulator
MKKKPERNLTRRLSSQAEALLGFLVTLADDEGFVELTRAKLAAARSVSVPTITRALRKLREAGELKLIKRGGGRGRPSRYRITALSREPLHRTLTRGDNSRGEYWEASGQGAKTSAKPDHDDPDHEPDFQPEAIQTSAADLGRTVVTGAAAWLKGAAEAWRALPTWQRTALAGLPLSTLGIFVGKRYGGRLGAAIGGGAGLLAAAALASLVPPQKEPAEAPTSSVARGPRSDPWLTDYHPPRIW